jgi:hypothetical protein
VKEWADRLIRDGVEIVFDIYDLKGADKYAFMERMVTDASVTHVLMFCDKAYAEKADRRKAGVGAESQIISKEVYDRVDQRKFIAITCEKDPAGEPCLPTYLKSRIYIDFTTPEAANQNWEQLVRFLFGKPLHQKPALGKPPSYLENQSVPASPMLGKFSALKYAILNGRPGVELYRREFLDTCISYVDERRVRQDPGLANWGQQVLEA